MVFTRLLYRSVKGTIKLSGRVIIGSTICLSGTAFYLSMTEKETDPVPWQIAFLNTLPNRSLSRLWGSIHHLTLPIFMRKPLYLLWSHVFGCNLNEMNETHLENYENLNSFFTRRLRPNARNIEKGDVVSPCDGLVTGLGQIQPDGNLSVTIKGLKYNVTELIGDKTILNNITHPLYYAVVYLSPGDYHRIHAPNNVDYKNRLHITGDLLPVAPKLADRVPGLFSRNERISLNGQWKYGFSSLVAVGAYNVGSIALVREPNMLTNISNVRMGEIKQRYYDDNTLGNFEKGEEVASFQLGSTVVVIFEAPNNNNFKFRVLKGQKVRVGQTIATL